MDAHVIAARSGATARLPGLRLLGDERLALMVAAERGEDAFVAIYERYHQPLYRYCRSMLPNDCDAQDALQSAFAGAFAALRRGRRDAPVRPWLFTIVHNEAVSVMRRRRPDAELLENTDGSTVTLEEFAEERERLRVLLADLSELPERQRQALVLKELNGLSHEEIAAVLRASVDAAKQTLFEARRSLREYAEGRAMACDDVCRAISDDSRYAMRRRRVRAHLRACAACAAFAAGIETRRADLHALAPALPAVAATGLLVRLLGGGSSHGGSGAGGLTSAATGKSFGLIVSIKAAAAIAVLASATAGLATALRAASPAPHLSPPTMRSGHNVLILRSPGSASGATGSTPAASGARTARAQMRSDRLRLKMRSASHGGAGTHPAATAAAAAGAHAGPASGSPASGSSRSGVTRAAHPRTPSTGAHPVNPTGTHATSPTNVRTSAPSGQPVPTTPTALGRSSSTPAPTAGTSTTTRPAESAPTSPVTPTSTTTAPAGATAGVDGART